MTIHKIDINKLPHYQVYIIKAIKNDSVKCLNGKLIVSNNNIIGVGQHETVLNPTHYIDKDEERREREEAIAKLMFEE